MTLRQNDTLPTLVLVVDLSSTTERRPPGGVISALSSDGGLGIVEARSVEHGVSLLATRRPDAVLLVGDACDEAVVRACSRLCSATGGASPPILARTSYDDTASIARLCGAGVADVVGPDADALLALRLRGLVSARRASVALEEAEADLKRARRIARVVQFRFDPDARTFRWSSDPAVVVAGLGAEGTLSDALLSRIHAGDRSRVEAAFASRMAHQVDYRLVLANTEERLLYQEVETSIDAATGRLCLVGTVQDVTELCEAEGAVAQLAYYDELTSLPNRAHARRFLKAAIADARKRREQIAILAIDLDLFRRVNDTFGHSAGNSILEDVAVRLRGVVAEEAARGRPEAMVARLGGDEFAVILRDVAGDDETSLLFRKIASRLAAPYELGGAEIVLACSAGEARYPGNGGDADTLLKHAASAMHSAKELGGAGYKVFAAEMQKKLERKLDIERCLRAALASGTSLELHYQPKVDVTSRRVAGVEALVRWIPGASGLAISPFELVSVAEETGQIHPLGDWILRTASLQAKAWSVVSGGRIPVAVNISALQFGAPDFAEKVARAIEDADLPAELLHLEITEGVMMADAEAASRVLDELKQLGLRVAIDDFGTGYSSLAYLTRFPVDYLKIDRSFVTGIGVTGKSEMIISAIIALARSLSIEVVAEGVETEAQLDFLERQGPLEIQGWLFSKALPPELLLAWVERHENALRPELRATA